LCDRLQLDDTAYDASFLGARDSEGRVCTRVEAEARCVLLLSVPLRSLSFLSISFREEGSETDEQHRRGVVMGNGQFLPSSAHYSYSSPSHRGDRNTLPRPRVRPSRSDFHSRLVYISLLISAQTSALVYRQPLKDFIFSRGGYHTVCGPSLISSPFSVFPFPSLVFKTAGCDWRPLSALRTCTSFTVVHPCTVRVCGSGCGCG
jgi:hypothetical protein